MKKIVFFAAFLLLISNSFAGIVTAEKSNSFDKSANGYGWYINTHDKVSYDTLNNVLTGIYRKKATSDGTLGAAIGDFSSLNTQIVYTPTNVPGARYPDLSSSNGYTFVVWSKYNGTTADTDPMFTVYSRDEEVWTESKIIKDPNLKQMWGAWGINGDATYDPITKEYVWVVTSRVSDITSINYQVTVGRTKTPMDLNSWVWTNPEDLWFEGGTRASYLNSAEPLKFEWGSNGFGIGVGVADYDFDENEDVKVYNISWIYTKDYGKTWKTRKIESNRLKSYHYLPIEKTVNWNNSKVTKGDSVVTINDVIVLSSYDVVITKDNSVHMLTKINGGDKDSLFLKNDNGENVSGYYDMVGKLNGDSLMWEAKYIASYNGWNDNLGFESLVMNRHILSIGEAKGVLYASWLDRTDKDPIKSPIKGDKSSKFLDDAFVALSYDNGNTWILDDYTNKKGFNITNTPNLHESGWQVSENGAKSGDNIVFYGVNQYCDLANPTTITEPGLVNYEQFLHAWKITVPAVSIDDKEKDRNFSLYQNYPNPFNPVTTIKFSIAANENVSLTVYNSKGEVVKNLLNSKLNQGVHSVSFDGSSLNSGIYFYKLKTDKQSITKKMILVK